VWLGPVASVVLPPSALLNTDASPLHLRQSPVLGQILCLVLGQDHVPVLIAAVLVFLGVIDLHFE
jgi:hypothetical protein